MGKLLFSKVLKVEMGFQSVFKEMQKEKKDNKIMPRYNDIVFKGNFDFFQQILQT